MYVVWDGGYHVPGGFMGRVLMGKGTGTDFGTRRKPVPVHTHDPHVYPGVYLHVHMAGDSCHGAIICGWCIHYSQ